MGPTNFTIKDIKKIFQDMFKQYQEAITKITGGSEVMKIA